MTIFKYPVEVIDTFTIFMPDQAKILCVQMQGDAPMIWAVVDPLEAKRQRYFIVRGTGHPMREAAGAKYVGTFQMHGGSLVFHLFDGGYVA